MKRNTLHSLKDIYDTAAIRSIGADTIYEEYAYYTNGKFNDARHQDIVSPLVIPAHNEEGDLPATLLAAARTNDVLPIVMDNLSDDNTARIARRMGAVVVSVDYGRKMAATQEGVTFARDELDASAIYFTDADTLVPSNWSRSMSHHLKDNDTGRGSATFGNSILWHGPSLSADAILSSAKIARSVHRKITNGPVVARGHNYALQLDNDGQMMTSLQSLNPEMFAGDDYNICQALIKSGAAVLNTTDLDSYVITRNDRVSSIWQRMGKDYASNREKAYEQDFYGTPDDSN